ncbi:Putative ribosome biogenesis GTPase RsgA [Sulfitobacter sp. THAF37]|uniref:ribosome small subunit-dependent GTPase A n=1 Tax=Sulfitobacter sp. THAF37 TaxID=2587855 RepID=UPI00126839C4|nr:ribosome small subunit-dependent GTPase A [Sulfitobacter sp. THAF37]QFT59149.1 Putative ribosome biogenesis GTPase RsgA [Sulfitobacter sp. THAF37]
MTRDYSQFFGAGSAGLPKQELSPLVRLGWQSVFAQQTDVDELAATPPCRVVEVHRSGLRVAGDGFATEIPPGPEATVGDWLLFNPDQPQRSRVLDRKSLLKRRAAGHERKEQLIGANIDTAFIVTSCNADFNLAQLERYVALSMETQITPVILLTKADLSDDPAPYLADARSISDRITVLALDARGDEARSALAPWCKPGQIIAFLGSSGVGKSTLTNALSETAQAATQSIREDDARGRHTTSHRQLHITGTGCAVLDTPGMRELQLTDASTGLEETFADLAALAASCRFNDCAHDTEPGCAVQAGLETGAIDRDRLTRWRKLLAEEAFNSATLAQRRAKDRAFGKMVRGIVKENRK